MTGAGVLRGPGWRRLRAVGTDRRYLEVCGGGGGGGVVTSREGFLSAVPASPPARGRFVRSARPPARVAEEGVAAAPRAERPPFRAGGRAKPAERCGARPGPLRSAPLGRQPPLPAGR